MEPKRRSPAVVRAVHRIEWWVTCWPPKTANADVTQPESSD